MKKILTFGAFDPLHKGHEFFLQEAKKQGNYLTVIIGRNKTIEKVKGKLPKHNEQERLKAIQSLPFVDKARLGDKKDPLIPIKEENPDLICLGYDQNSFSNLIKDTPTLRIQPFKKDTYKSSLLKNK